MSGRKVIKTTIRKAVEYWSNYIDESDLSVDWSEAETHCWRCGCEKSLQRCHIIPHSLGGEDKASNIVLLCKSCHAEGPNVSDTEIMWDWIKAYIVPFYETFWRIQGLQEYKFIYKRSVFEDFIDIFNRAQITDETEIQKQMNRIIEKTNKKASVHFGQPYFNSATIAGLYRMLLKEVASSYHLEL